MSAARWDDVRVAFPDAARVGPASFSVAIGERVLLLGPSGSGKSSLLLALTGLIPEAVPADVTGRLQIGSVDARTRTPAEWADRVAHLFQAPERNLCGMTVEEEIAFALEQEGWPESAIRARVRPALRMVGLDESMAIRPVAALSGGEKQRVSLAATLAQGGDVLLIDEPTAHLDPAATARIHALLKRRTQAATVIVDHRLDGLLDAIDRVVVLGGSGEIIAEGAPRDVFRRHGERLAERGIWIPAAAELDAALHAGTPPTAPMPLQMDEALAALTPSPDTIDGVERYLAATAPRRSGGIGAPVVRLREAECRAPAGPVVMRGVSLTVHRGEVLALLGANGAGKSTLGLAFAGLMPLAAGWREGRPGGMALQSPDLQFVAGSVADELAASLPSRMREGFDAAAVLADWGLEGLEHRHPLALSEGQKRRLALAALDLVPGNDLLVLDEPTAGLDRGGVAALSARIAALADAGRAIVLITHDMELAWHLADTIALVADGRVSAPEPAAVVLADPQRLARSGLCEPAPAKARRWLAAATRSEAC